MRATQISIVLVIVPVMNVAVTMMVVVPVRAVAVMRVAMPSPMPVMPGLLLLLFLLAPVMRRLL